MSPKHLLDQIEIVSPCSADWDSMKGNDQIRFCEHCNRNVNDLTQITHKQIKRLIAHSNGRFCVRYYPGSGAPLPARSIPQKVHQIGRRVSRIAAGAFTAALSLSSTVAQTQQPNRANSANDELAIVGTVAANEVRGLSGAITGSIYDPNGALIAGASISLANEKTNLSLVTISDPQGEYKFESLEPGTYLLRVEAPGFSAAENSNIVVAPNARQRIDKSLEVAGVVAEVEIRAEIIVDRQVMGGVMIAAPVEPLVKAAQEDNLQGVRDALLTTANVNVRDKNTDTTALEQAVGNGNRDMVQVLIWAGANVNARDRSRQTALMLLGETATSDIVWDLVSAGAKVNAKDEDGDTPLTQAAERDNERVLKALLDAGAKVDAKNNAGQTAIMIAASEGLLNNIKALILAGADMNARDNDGKTALTHAKENERSEAAKLLESYGAQE